MQPSKSCPMLWQFTQFSAPKNWRRSVTTFALPPDLISRMVLKSGTFSKGFQKVLVRCTSTTIRFPSPQVARFGPAGYTRSGAGVNSQVRSRSGRPRQRIHAHRTPKRKQVYCDLGSIFSGVGYAGKKFPSPGDSQTLTPVLGFPSGGRQQVREKVNEIFASAR